MNYINLKYTPDKDDLICDFRLEPAKGFSVEDVAGRIASESSTGTWTDVPMNSRIKSLGAKVFEIKGNQIKIAYTYQLFEPGNMPQILSSIAGNIFGMKAVKNLRLEDIKWPYKIIKSFKGPKFGIDGIRKLLKVEGRPLVGTIVKPKVGLTSKEHAKVAYDAWVGGLDLVKADENLASLKFNKFEKNVKETLKMKRKAENETGENKVYVPNITAETNEMLKRAELVKREGGNFVMIDIITSGWSALQTLRKEDLEVVIHAHRSGHGIFTRGKHGISMLTIAKISRLIGVDQIHTGTANVGKMKGGEQEVKKIDDFLRSKWFNVKPVFPIASGGLHAGLVPRIIEILGRDIIIQAGGGVHGLGTRTGAAAMRQAVESSIYGIPLEEYAKTHKELKLSIKKWGYEK